MLWAFSPLLPGAAHQQSDPGAVSITESATSGDACGVTVVYAVAGSGGGTAVDDKTGVVPVSGSALEAAGTAVVSGNGYAYSGRDSGGAAFLDYAKISYVTEAVGAVSGALLFGILDVGGTQSATKGYTGGGYAFSTDRTDIYALTFSNETHAGLSAALATARHSPCASASSSKALWFGGYDNAVRGYTDGIVLSNETADNPSASLAVSTTMASAVTSSSTAYICGGYTTVQELQGWVWASDTTTNPTATIKTSHSGSGGAAASDTTGYLHGHLTGAADWHKLDFATETTDWCYQSYTNDKWNHSTCGTGASAYVLGGEDAFGLLDSIEKFVFSTQILTSLSATLAAPRKTGGGLSSASVTYAATDDANGGLAQYVATPESASAADASTGTDGVSRITEPTNLGAEIGKGYFHYNAAVARVDYSTDAYTASVATLSTNAPEASASLSSPTSGYFLGSAANNLSRLQFSNLASATLASTFGETLSINQTCFSSVTRGYMFGDNSATAQRCFALTYPTETAAISGAALANHILFGGGTKSLTKGYVMGGVASGTGIATDNIEKLDFATEAIEATTSNLSSPRSGMYCFSSATRGYVCGGGNVSDETTVESIRFSDDAIIAGANALPVARSSAQAGISSSLAGYGIYGSAFIGHAIKLLFSNEAVSDTASGLDYRTSSEGVENSVIERGMYDSASATGAMAVVASGTAAATESSNAPQGFAVAITEAATAGAESTVATIYITPITGTASAGDSPAATFSVVVSATAGATPTADQSGAVTYPVALGESASPTDSHDAIVPSLSVAAIETASAVADHPATAMFVSAASDAATAAESPVGGFLVGRGESAAPADTTGATITFTLDSNASASAIDSTGTTIGFPVGIAQVASAVWEAMASTDISATADEPASGVSVVSQAELLVQFFEQGAATESSDAAPSADRYSIQVATAIATQSAIGPVPASRIEAAAAGEVSRGYNTVPVAVTADAVPTDAAVPFFPLYAAESAYPQAVADGYGTQQASGAASAVAAAFHAAYRVVFASGEVAASPSSEQDAEVRSIIVASATGDGDGVANHDAVVRIGASLNESVSAAEAQSILGSMSAAAVESATASSYATGGRLYSGSVVVLLNAADYSDAEILDLLPHPLCEVTKVIRRGGDAYVVSMCVARVLELSPVDRAIAVHDSSRTVALAQHPRLVGAADKARDVTAKDDERDV